MPKDPINPIGYVRARLEIALRWLRFRLDFHLPFGTKPAQRSDLDRRQENPALPEPAPDTNLVLEPSRLASARVGIKFSTTRRSQNSPRPNGARAFASRAPARDAEASRASLMRRKKPKPDPPEAPEAGDGDMPSWVAAESPVRTTPYTEAELDRLVEDTLSGVRDTIAWHDLVGRVGEQAARRELRARLIMHDANARKLTRH